MWSGSCAVGRSSGSGRRRGSWRRSTSWSTAYGSTSPCSRVQRSCTATTASATAWWTRRPDASRPYSIGSSALGDPLADLGYLGVYWTDSGSTPRRRDPSAAGTFPPFAALVERYAARTGRDVAAVEYFRAFSSWRLAVILEGVYARYLHGVMGEAPQVLQHFAADVEQLAESALASLDRSG